MTTVQLDNSTWKALNQRKEAGETFDDVVESLLERTDPRGCGYREDAIVDTVMAREIYPREEMKQRIRKHAFDTNSDLLLEYDIQESELEIRWMMFEDGVIHYKVTHEDMPAIIQSSILNKGPNTEVVPDVQWPDLPGEDDG